MRPRPHLVLLLALAAASTSCNVDERAAPEAPSVRWSPAAVAPAPDPPPRLSCPGGLVVATDGGLLEQGAGLHGADTPGEAVEAWIAATGGSDHVLTDDATEAWVLRADGTARARVHLLVSDGWVVHGYEACA